MVRGCPEAPYHFLKATAAAMKATGNGQILLITSASAAVRLPVRRSTRLYVAGDG